MNTIQTNVELNVKDSIRKGTGKCKLKHRLEIISDCIN